MKYCCRCTSKPPFFRAAFSLHTSDTTDPCSIKPTLFARSSAREPVISSLQKILSPLVPAVRYQMNPADASRSPWVTALPRNSKSLYGLRLLSCDVFGKTCLVALTMMITYACLSTSWLRAAPHGMMHDPSLPLSFLYYGGMYLCKGTTFPTCSQPAPGLHRASLSYSHLCCSGWNFYRRDYAPLKVLSLRPRPVGPSEEWHHRSSTYARKAFCVAVVCHTSSTALTASIATSSRPTWSGFCRTR
jgi:hypothetical protein